MHWEAVSDMPGYLDTTANRCTSESRVPTQWIPAPHGTPHTGGSPLSVCDLYCTPSGKPHRAAVRLNWES